MLTEREIYKQNMTDMLRINKVLSQILATKELTVEDENRIKYCIKIQKNVTEKEHLLNKNFKP